MTVNLRNRLFGMIALAMAGIAALALINALNARSDLLAEKKLKTRHLVEAAHGVLEYWHARHQSGDTDEASAQRAALESIRAMRYEGKEYFWINDFTTPIPKMVMHPAAPSLEGKSTDGEKYNRATSMQDGVSGPVVPLDGERNIIVVFNEVANRAGHGYVTYGWPKPVTGGGTTKELYPKMSFVKKFEGWNWLIGSGIYIDDVDSAFRDKLLRGAMVGGGIMAILLFMSVWIARRITALDSRVRERTVELEQANEDLRQMDRMKSDFLSSVSHELRTPLTSILGFVSLVVREFSRSFVPLAEGDAALDKKARRIQDNLDIVQKESERLTRLINDVLDLAKIESGRTEWHDAPMQVAALVQDAVNAARGMFAQKPEVALELEIADNLPAFMADADRLQQVLVNLINNAVKFTDRGAVTMRAFLNEQSMIQIEVRDTGAGFPPEDAESIFDKFQQSRQGDTLDNRPKGTGLGLAICKEIVEHYDGRIWAASEPGKGSVFALTLPGALAVPAAPRPGGL